MSATPHLVFELPLVGCHRIEASAGTGKTFTLALLHTRLVIERGLSVRQILAVTFTNAAAQELRARLRRQLDLAARLAARGTCALRALRDDASAANEQRLTVQLILRRLDDEPGERLAARLREASAQMDLAAVFTIHGLCQRVLGEQALAAGEALQARELLGSERSLWEEVAHDIWRQWSRAGADATRLLDLWASPQALAADLPELLRAQRLLPASAAVDAGAEPRAQQAAAALREAWREHGAAAQAAVAVARERKVLNGNKLQTKTLQALWQALAQFADDPLLTAPETKALEKLRPEFLRECANDGHAAEVPTLPLFEIIAQFLDADAAQQRAQAQARANLLQRLREEAAVRLARHKRERGQWGFDDLIAGVANALQGPHREALAQALRRQYPVALVDEFQDTDARQWQIFRRLYVDPPAADDADAAPTALMLIGDPKQAIYRFRGGDVHTYHRAGRSAASTHALDANFRSRPGVLAAIHALFARGGVTPFGDGETRFPAVHAGGHVADADFLLGDAPAPAMHLWQLPLDAADCTQGSTKTPPRIKADSARALATQATVARIHALLGAPQARLRDGDAWRPVQPGDIAVLVNTHTQAALVQAALAAAGIPAVTAGRASLYASEQARELLWLLQALRDLGHDGRLRCALLSVLLGQDAATVAALDADESAHRQWLDRFAQWRQRWETRGPLAMLGDRIADAAPRLLALADGERRLSNYLQLAEQLQEASVTALGHAGLVDWLAQRIALADDRDETQQLRLESDALRVRILTLHKAKGLEFALVFLPFVALPASGGRAQGLALIECESDDGDDRNGGRVLHARLPGLNDADYARAKASAHAEAQAEQLRLLYVGLTRARHALWLACGAIHQGEHSALMQLLGGGAAVSDATLTQTLATLAADSGGRIVCEAWPERRSTAPGRREREAQHPLPYREAVRILRRDWWVYSFSQLAHAEGGGEDSERGAEDESRPPPETDPDRAPPSPFVGTRFGNVLHAALERIDFARWRAAPEAWAGAEVAPRGQAEVLCEALRDGGFDRDTLLGEGSRLLARLIGHTLNVALPEGVRLCELGADSRRNELEFHFALQPVAVAALLALLHRHGLLPQRHGFGARERIEGLMTGKIDLVYTHAGRWYLLDYKSNRLPGYAPAEIAAAMIHGEYDLQYLIYTLALHRWLRFRLPGYRYAEHFGGVRYLFCRGLDALRADAPGVFACRPDAALVDALDALFGHAHGEPA